MFWFGKPNQTYTKIGVARAYLPRTGSQPVRPGGDYFVVQVHGAQAAFAGFIWDNVKGLLVTSTINLNHPLLGDQDLRALRRSIDVQKNRAQQLGLSPNLISLVPASMTHVSVAINFVLDKENRLVTLSSLINSDSFMSVVSLAPGASLVAKTISDLAQKVIQAFIPAAENTPILQFSGDFDITGTADGLQDGYYVILATVDEQNPLPALTTRLEVQDGTLLAEGQPVTQLSYVVLSVTRSPTRPRELSNGAAWEAKLREAEDAAQTTGADPFVDDSEKKTVWTKCKQLIQEAQVLLAADPNFLRQDSENIWKVSYKKCLDALTGKAGALEGIARGPAAAALDTPDDRLALGMEPTEDLAGLARRYSQEVAQASQILKRANAF